MKKIILVLICIITIILMILPVYSMDINYIFDTPNNYNTNHGWEVKKNSKHEQPEIPINEKEMLEKYNGIYVGNPNNKIIYITIDLGYENGYTQKVLDVLNKNNVKATFFIIKDYLNRNEEIIDRIVKEGHSLQNHTTHYKHLNILSEYDIEKEILELDDIVNRKYNIKMKYLRLPYEDWSNRVMNIAFKTGYKTVFWSIACVDWVEGKEASYISNSIIKNYHNGAIVLMHTVSASSPNTLDIVIKSLKKLGYDFSILDI